ncbi:MAG: 4-hydroxy-tetrahydrodipicolinate synthase [Thermoleophilaceae bacterium]|nr:4-hydroxy-tetrahydrodipicolinate synthase [Thermoleophilaceae bacterium]
MTFGGIITAAVTPFGEDGRVDEEAFVEILRHLAANGSDGVVVAGTTGEGTTLDDAEKEQLFELAVAEKGELTVIAGTGSNDTAHTVHLTERAGEIGCDGALVVTPYYNKPNPKGIRAHYAAVAATGVPVVLYNIPSRCVVDIPNELLCELGQTENVVAVKQARYKDLEPIDGLDLLAGNDDVLAQVMDAGGTGGIVVASHVVGPEMRRMVEDPGTRWEIHESLGPVFDAMAVTVNPIPVKTAMGMLGHRVGGFRLPMVDASEDEAAVIRGALERHGLLAPV